MNAVPKSMIIGSGSYAPEKILTNKDLEKMVDTSDEWIQTRTGMKVRHIIAEGENTSDMAAKAAQQALADASVKAKDIDLIIVATISGDVGFPSTAIYVQELLGAYNAAVFDVSAACSGFIYGLEIANAQIASGKYKNVLVIGVEALSRMTDYEDRNTCVLFGDGGGAVVLQPSDGQRGVLDTFIKSDGRLNDLLYIPGLGTKNPPTHETVDKRMQFIKMAGREVFKHAVKAMGDSAVKILESTGMTGEDVSLLIPHQANLRIIDATARRAGIPGERVYVNIDKYGNTSAASIPLALDEALGNGTLKKNDVVVLVAFGAGFTWGSAAIVV